MINKSCSTFLVFFIVTLFTVNTQGASLPTEIIFNKEYLLSVKKKIQEGDLSCSKGLKVLIRLADKALNNVPYSVMNKTDTPPSGDKHDYVSLAPYYWPDPNKPDGLPYLRKDGRRNTEVEKYQDRVYLPQMTEDVEVLALAYFFSDDEKYAIHATKLISTWFLEKETKMNPNLNFAQAIKGHNEGRGAGLVETRHFITVIESVKLLNGSKSWTGYNNEMLKKWFAEFLNWMQTSPNGTDEIDAPNNHGTWYDAQRLSLALYIGQMESAKNIANNLIQRLDKQMTDEGSFPKELERTIALHYSTFNLYAFFVASELAESTGVDVWNAQTASSKSLKKGFDYLYPFITKTKKWKGQQIKPFDFNEPAPLLLKASVKLSCSTCLNNVDRLGLKEDDLLLLLLVTEHKE
jgi:hypothetical protein